MELESSTEDRQVNKSFFLKCDQCTQESIACYGNCRVRTIQSTGRHAKEAPFRWNLIPQRGMHCAEVFTCSLVRNTVYHTHVRPTHRTKVSLTFVTCNARGCFLFHCSPACFLLLHSVLVATHYNKSTLWPTIGFWPTVEKYCVQKPTEFQNDREGGHKRAGEVRGQGWRRRVW